MDMKKTGFKKSMGGVLLAVLSNVAVAQSHSLPEFHISNQSLISSLFSADVDVFGLGGLEDLGSNLYKATFEGISGAAIGSFTVLTLDTPFSPLDPSMVLGGNFFGGMTPNVSFEFMTTPNKYHVAVVSGLSGSSMNANYNLHVSAVPEAEAWGMMLAGLGLLGAVATRSQRRDAVSV